MRLLLLAAALLHAIAIVRMWRSARAMAVAMALFPPVAVYALGRYWHAPHDDIRVPLLAALAALGLYGAMAAAAGGASVPPARDADVAAARTTAQIRGNTGAVRASAVPTRAYQRGHVAIPLARAAIDVPAHFRFIDAAALRAAQMAGADASPGTTMIGWLVHESVDPASASAWHVRIDWIGAGFITDDEFTVQGRESLLAQAQRASPRLAHAPDGAPRASRVVDYAQAPSLDMVTHEVTWAERMAHANPPAQALDCHAARLGRRGALVYSIVDFAPQRAELCRLGVHVAAARSRFDRDETYADHSRLFDSKAAFDLVALVTGTFALPQ